AARPGDTVCFTGQLPDRLVIDQGGTSDSPVTYSGNSQAVVPGITARADHIVIEGFVVAGADSTGIWASGTNIVVRDNDISAVHRAGVRVRPHVPNGVRPHVLSSRRVESCSP
ncbi:MAG TPA: hypothetical protein VE476_10895, partial [Propionibacteriaceae bacterium]|nr:hypothetical protein [Propionibacteriaceae bacterium]